MHALHLDDRAVLRSAIFETLQVIVSLSTSATSDRFVSFSLDLSSSDGSVPESWERRQQHGRNKRRNDQETKESTYKPTVTLSINAITTDKNILNKRHSFSSCSCLKL